MKAFIKKHEYNFIRRCLLDLNNTFRSSIDMNIIETNKIYLQNKILNIFTDLSQDKKNILDISCINDAQQIDAFIKGLDKYVYGMPKISDSQITKLFKKEKKLKLPSADLSNSKNIYLGWIDESTRKLFIIYNINGRNIGMTCKISSQNSNNAHICAFCNHVGNENEVAFVSAICKTSNTKYGTYKSIGFTVCLDSKKCNNQITSLDKLEHIIKEVNNLI